MHDFARPKRKIFKNCKFLVFNNVQFFRAPLNFLYIQDRFLLQKQNIHRRRTSQCEKIYHFVQFEYFQLFTKQVKKGLRPTKILQQNISILTKYIVYLIYKKNPCRLQVVSFFSFFTSNSYGKNVKLHEMKNDKKNMETECGVQCTSQCCILA